MMMIDGNDDFGDSSDGDYCIDEGDGAAVEKQSWDD